MDNLVKRLLRLAFDIHEGEYGRALLMQLNIFLIVLVLLIAKPVVNALFLTHVGVEQLPVVFVLVAVVAMVVSTAYARALGRARLLTIINGTIAIAVTTLVGLAVLLKLEPAGTWIYYAFYVAVAIFGLVATSQVWILANLLFNTREATRLFGFIGAGAIGGGITGGYLTSVLAPLLSSENLLFVAAGILVTCIPLSTHIWKQNIARLSVLQRRRRLPRFGEHPIKIIRGSRHLLLLASIVGVGVIVAKLVDYQFSALASAAIESSDELAAFFGFWFSTFNMISLLIQLFLTRRIVGVYGVGYSLFLLPTVLFFGAGLLLIFPILAVGIFLKAADVTLKQSVNKSATELLALPIPVGIKNQTKSFIDVFVDSAATGIGGLILIFMVSGLDLSVRFVSLMILPLLALWIYFAVGIRQEYLRLFKRRISNAGDRDDAQPDFNIDTVLGGLRKVLRSGEEQQILYVLRKAAEQKETRLVDDVRPLIGHASPAVRAEALETLYFFRSPNFSEEVEMCVSDRDPRVRVNAVNYLIEHSRSDRFEVISRYLDDPDSSISAAALIAVARESRNNPKMTRLAGLHERLVNRSARLSAQTDPALRRHETQTIARAIGAANLQTWYDTLTVLLGDQDPEIVDSAILGAGLTLSSDFTSKICSKLAVPRHRSTAIRALVDCGKGIVETMDRLVVREEVAAESIRWMPKVAEQFDTQDSVEFLFKLTKDPDVGIQIEALRSLNALKTRYPHLKVYRRDVIERIVEESQLYLDTLAALYAENHRVAEADGGPGARIAEARRSLIDLLERRLDVILERIFRLLGLRYPPDEVIPIFEGLQSESHDLRSNAVEYLDNLLHGHLKRILIPIAETAMLQSVTEETIRALRIDIPNQTKCFETLLCGRDVKVKQAVLFLIGELDDSDYLQLAQTYARDPDRRVSDFASAAVSKITANELS